MRSVSGADSAEASELSNTGGNLFCYLPLPIKSGLPVHINGAFAVTSNRRHLIEKVTDNKSNQLVEWNTVLMSDSVCKVSQINVRWFRARANGRLFGTRPISH